MAKRETKKAKDLESWKPGSEPEAAGQVGSPDDFGVPVGSGPSRDRDYVSENTKRSDRGAAQARSGEDDGQRTTGAGASASGVGSSSAGDVDTDTTGVGFGTVAQSGPGGAIGKADSDGTSNEFAAAVPSETGDAEVIPAEGRGQSGVHKHGGSPAVTGGSTVQGPDAQSTVAGQGADAATNPAARGDDAFSGEISSGEASGQDQPISPSSDSQGASPGDNQTGGAQKDMRGNA